MSREYKNKSSEIGKWLKCVFGLPLLDPEEVSECFTSDLMSISPNDERIIMFCDYLVENYVDDGAKFNPRLWASRKISSERTTNSSAFFHSKLNSEFTKYHPNIFTFTHVLNMKIQTDTYIKMNGINKPKLNQNKTFNNKKKTVEDLLIRLNNKQISTFSYLQQVSTYYHV